MGRVVPLISDASHNRVLFFTTKSIVDDPYGLVYISESSGFPELWYYSLESADSYQLTMNQVMEAGQDGWSRLAEKDRFFSWSTALDDQRGWIYYIKGSEIHRVNIAGQDDIFAELPPQQLCWWSMNLSADGKLLAVPVTEEKTMYFPEGQDIWQEIDKKIELPGQCSTILIYDTMRGRVIREERVENGVVTCAQFNPENSDLLLFNHKWSRDPGTQRIWLSEGGEHRPLRPAEEGYDSADWICHEVWSPCGQYIIYHGVLATNGRAMIGRMKADGSDKRELALPEEWLGYGHFFPMNDHELLTDGYYPQDVNDKGQCQWVCKVDINWDTGSVSFYPLGRHDSTWETQEDHPHPFCDPYGRWVYFTGRDKGHRSIMRIMLDP